MNEAKQCIRSEIHRRRDCHDAADRQRAGARIAIACDRLMNSHFRSKSILCYVSASEEVPTHNLIRSCIKRGIRTCVPWSNPHSRTMHASELLNFETGLKPGFAGILEPAPKTRKPVAISEIDLFFAPGVAFDLAGSRLGRGGGFYDRYLAQCSPSQIKVGLAFSWQIVEQIPREPHDVPMDLIVTDECVIEIREGLLES